MSVPLKMFRLWAFLGMMSQVSLKYHRMLVKLHLETVFGTFGTVLDLFRSYLTKRRQFVALGGKHVWYWTSIYWHPSGLNPRTLLLYTYSWTLVIKYNFYADETQIYIHYKHSQSETVSLLTKFISEIKSWMVNNFRCFFFSYYRLNVELILKD